MKKVKIISLSIFILLASISLVGCTEEKKTEDTNTTPQPTIGKNLLSDSGFEDISTGFWDIAGYITTNITQIYGVDDRGDDILLGFKIENNTLRYHNQIKYNGSMSAYIQGLDEFDFSVLNNWYQIINDPSVIPYGKDLVLSCWIKTKDAEEVILMVQCWDDENLTLNNLLSYQSSLSYGNITGTDIWEEYSIKLVDVPDDTKVITVRLGLIGTGEVWFDDAQLYTVS